MYLYVMQNLRKIYWKLGSWVHKAFIRNFSAFLTNKKKNTLTHLHDDIWKDNMRTHTHCFHIHVTWPVLHLMKGKGTVHPMQQINEIGIASRKSIWNENMHIDTVFPCFLQKKLIKWKKDTKHTLRDNATQNQWQGIIIRYIWPLIENHIFKIENFPIVCILYLYCCNCVSVKDISRKLFILWEKELIETCRAEISSSLT